MAEPLDELYLIPDGGHSHYHEYGAGNTVDQLQSDLLKLISRIEGLYSVAVSDKDGVPIVYVTSQNIPEVDVKGILPAINGIIDQASKLSITESKSLVAQYKSYQVILINRSPVYISFVTARKVNTGLILTLDDDVMDILGDIKSVIR
ncbi:Ragulator complex protein LAMTOR3 [Trichoplax sp. H2]|nr:Ragulator complex protein LAMTOR3 [Trichoplax sp. H2]|eukprot:RDD36894.1 Ragulator complex protein LAMTOR3 [Trichoplax sp. H2]